ncbi:hypothetical protein H5201_15780 [Pseudoalteromonas sp. SG43-6]|uniref:hypothetical protein n=1 Tax=Pseudoalteromonas sp. SG43-6 TaxID=2760967 RepID=UPI001600FD95|nr:hypothetical protein [Pseudoalteromonas sp. SG43-6]MBB1435728.1 hypothetical protein [Pseudoalteromonas sp. SG43-6]
MFKFFKASSIKSEESTSQNTLQPDTDLYEINGVVVSKADVEKTSALLKKQAIDRIEGLELRAGEILVHRGRFISFIDVLDKPIWLSRSRNAEHYSRWCDSEYGVETKFNLFAEVNVLYVNHDWESHILQCPNLFGSKWNTTLSEALKSLGYDGVLTVGNGTTSEIMLAAPQHSIQPLDCMRNLTEQITQLDSIFATKMKSNKSVTVHSLVPKDSNDYFKTPSFRWFELTKDSIEDNVVDKEIESRHYQNISMIQVSNEELSSLDSSFFPSSLKMALYRKGVKALVVDNSIFICKTCEGWIDS